MKSHILLVVASSFLLTACATSSEDATRIVGVNQPPEYRAGYSAGCDSGYVAAGHPYYQFKKDVARFGADEVYRTGWNDGFVTCKGQYDSVRR